MLVIFFSHIYDDFSSYDFRGSAFPATLAFQIRELERETRGDLKLDAIVTVIDAENFKGYEDKSPTAKLQASYSDMILIVSTDFHLVQVRSDYRNMIRTSGSMSRSVSLTSL